MELSETCVYVAITVSAWYGKQTWGGRGRGVKLLRDSYGSSRSLAFGVVGVLMVLVLVLILLC